MKPLPPEMMAPHSGVGEGTPRPRKLIEAALMMHITMSEARYTMELLMTLGRMWRNMMVRSL